MEYNEACRILSDFGLGELLDPNSWHWTLNEKGWFKHNHDPEYVNIKHISNVLREKSLNETKLISEALFIVSKPWKISDNKILQNASEAILLLKLDRFMKESNKNLKQEPDPRHIMMKPKWITNPDNKEKIKMIVKFFGFDKGLDDTTNRLHEAIAHVGNDMTDEWSIDPQLAIEKVLKAINECGKERKKYIPPRLICKHMSYLLAEISRYHYGHDVDIVETIDGSEIIRNKDGSKLTRHVVVYDRTDDVYRDPSVYWMIFDNGIWKPKKESSINTANLTAKQAGVILK